MQQARTLALCIAVAAITILAGTSVHQARGTATGSSSALGSDLLTRALIQSTVNPLYFDFDPAAHSSPTLFWRNIDVGQNNTTMRVTNLSVGTVIRIAHSDGQADDVYDLIPGTSIEVQKDSTQDEFWSWSVTSAGMTGRMLVSFDDHR